MMSTPWRRRMTAIFLTFALSALPRAGEAQAPSHWGRVDTVTSGAADEFNPVLAHADAGFGSPPPVWMLFERRTPGESQVVARRYNSSLPGWDTTDIVIASGPAAGMQVKPAYAALYYYDPGLSADHTVHFALWQRWEAARWRLYYSMVEDIAVSWSPPSLLVDDSVDNTDARVQHAGDSTFLVAWKRGSAIVGLFRRPSSFTVPETLGVSGAPTFDFDMGARGWTCATLIWTTMAGGAPVAVWRNVSASPSMTTPPETLRTAFPCFSPRAFTGYYPGPEFTYESPVSGVRQVFYYLSGYQSGQLTSDAGAESRNCGAYLVPVVIKPARGTAVSYFPMDIVVFERTAPGDSSLVFVENNGLADTVRTPGHNRSVCIGSAWITLPSGPNLLTVWESNRTGMSHIYSRLVPFYFAGIAPAPPQPGAFQLLQNYPNPFNPSTTIRYVLPGRTRATISLFNSLGQRVATLVDAVQDAGEHQVRVDGTRLGSGVYFYRLTAGDAALTRRLVILR